MLNRNIFLGVACVLRPPIGATAERLTAGTSYGRCGAEGAQIVVLRVADTNHLLSIHIWIMLGNVEQLIWVRKWLRGLPGAVPHGHARYTETTRRSAGGQRAKMSKCWNSPQSFCELQ